MQLNERNKNKKKIFSYLRSYLILFQQTSLHKAKAGVTINISIRECAASLNKSRSAVGRRPRRAHFQQNKQTGGAATSVIVEQIILGGGRRGGAGARRP